MQPVFMWNRRFVSKIGFTGGPTLFSKACYNFFRQWAKDLENAGKKPDSVGKLDATEYACIIAKKINIPEKNAHDNTVRKAGKQYGFVFQNKKEAVTVNWATSFFKATRGTPFSKACNSFFKQWNDELRKAGQTPAFVPKLSASQYASSIAREFGISKKNINSMTVQSAGMRYGFVFQNVARTPNVASTHNQIPFSKQCDQYFAQWVDELRQAGQNPASVGMLNATEYGRIIARKNNIPEKTRYNGTVRRVGSQYGFVFRQCQKRMD